MIKLFNDALNARYLTLERNIKSKSNSFYNSYLDLFEATIKCFLDENNITVLAKVLFIYKRIIYVLLLITPLIYTRELFSPIFIPNWVAFFISLQISSVRVVYYQYPDLYLIRQILI